MKISELLATADGGALDEAIEMDLQTLVEQWVGRVDMVANGQDPDA